MEKKKIIAYDLTMMPMGLSGTEMYEIYERTGFVLYSSMDRYGNRSKGDKPYFLDGEGDEKIMIDITTEEGKELYKKLTKKE